MLRCVGICSSRRIPASENVYKGWHKPSWDIISEEECKDLSLPERLVYLTTHKVICQPNAGFEQYFAPRVACLIITKINFWWYITPVNFGKLFCWFSVIGFGFREIGMCDNLIYCYLKCKHRSVYSDRPKLRCHKFM